MQTEANSEYHNGAAAHPLAELLACPPGVGNVLNGAAECIEFNAGDTLFRQSSLCRGLYLVISGQLLRKAERIDARLTLGIARPGDLVELAAALGDGYHTFTITAQTPGSVLLLPVDALRQAFEAYPPLRMQLLEELAREVSRAYESSCAARIGGVRKHAN